MSWKRFTILVFVQACILSGATLAAIILIDPYDHFSFSLPARRGAIVDIDRLIHPGLAKARIYDSAVIGTSFARTMRPETLSRLMGGRFLNLGLDGGNAREQSLVLRLFLQRQASPRTVVFEITPHFWCWRQGRVDDLKPRYEVPSWLYDDNPWNDIVPHFDLTMADRAIRQLGYILGLRTSRETFAGGIALGSHAKLVHRAKRHIAQYRAQRLQEAATDKGAPTAAERRAWRFPPHALFKRMLDSVPAEASTVVIFPPLNVAAQPWPGTRKDAAAKECKRRIRNLALRRTNTHVFDFHFESAITRRDENYVDALHLDAAAADRFLTLIARGVQVRQDMPNRFRYWGNR